MTTLKCLFAGIALFLGVVIVAGILLAIVVRFVDWRHRLRRRRERDRRWTRG